MKHDNRLIVHNSQTPWGDADSTVIVWYVVYPLVSSPALTDSQTDSQARGSPSVFSVGYIVLTRIYYLYTYILYNILHTVCMLATKTPTKMPA
jgi:hypothetical protein